jgi:hypothetical protein
MCAKGHTDFMTVLDLIFYFEVRKVVVLPNQYFVLSMETVLKQIRLNYSAVSYFKPVRKSLPLPLLSRLAQSIMWKIFVEWLTNV